MTQEVPVDALRKGSHVMLQGHPCKITEMTQTKMMSWSSGRVDPWEDTNAKHYDIWCNACEQPLTGDIRYVCLDCADYDLCEACEAKNEHGHVHQVFAKIRSSRTVNVNKYRSK
jgi:hypothetical protein